MAKRAFLAIAWGVNPGDTQVTGPYETTEAARAHLADAIGEGETVERGAVLGPMPITYLDDEPDTPAALQVASVDQLHELMNTVLEHAINVEGVDLKAALTRLETDLGDWSENLEDQGGMPITWTFARTLQDNFSADEILALYEATADNPANAGKRAVIRDAYARVSGSEL